MEEAFVWLLAEFGAEKIRCRKVMRPVPEDFPIQFDQSENDAYALLPVIAAQMETAPGGISLNFYDQTLVEFSAGSGRMFSQQTPGEQYSAGTFRAGKKNGKYLISIEAAQLKSTENLVATLAHEIAHIKLLGEGRIKENDEHLTDLVPVIFGLGIFNANSSFNFYVGHDSWGYSKQGYLSQQEWGYALALFAYFRNEGEKPEWANYLVPNIRSDFRKAMGYIVGNKDKILLK